MASNVADINVSEEPVWKRSRRSDTIVDEAARIQRMSLAVKTLIECMGEDASRDGLLKTPDRAAKALMFLTKGYTMTVEEEVNSALFDVESDNTESTSSSSSSSSSTTTQQGGMVVVRDIEISSLCEHHLVPFVGRAHIGYIPKKKILGLSKLARITEVYARRLQVQERLTRQIANSIHQVADPDGVGVVIECSHMCMCMRGVLQVGSTTSTTFYVGSFQKDQNIRKEFLDNVATGKRN